LRDAQARRVVLHVRCVMNGEPGEGSDALDRPTRLAEPLEAADASATTSFPFRFINVHSRRIRDWH
jgi:hypothetical protein